MRGEKELSFSTPLIGATEYSDYVRSALKRLMIKHYKLCIRLKGEKREGNYNKIDNKYLILIQLWGDNGVEFRNEGVSFTYCSRK